MAAGDDSAAMVALKQRLARRLSPTLLDAWPPPFAGDWKPLTAEEAVALMAKACLRLAGVGDRNPWPLAHGQVALRAVRMPCYADTLYVEAVLVDRMGAHGRAAMLLRNARTFPLTNESDALYRLNVILALDLTSDEQADAYLRLFCWTVCGDQGPFQIVEDVSLIPESPVFKPDPDRVGLRPDLRLSLTPESAEGRQPVHRRIATLLYDDALFEAHFDIHAHGDIEMTDDEPMHHFRPHFGSWRMGRFTRYFEPNRQG